jgi:Zn-dependent protease
MSRSSALLVERNQTAPRPTPLHTPRARAPRLAGVTVRADLSCGFGALLTAWTFASGFLPETDEGRSAIAYWSAGAVGAGLVMVSLLLHELGHAIAARRVGLGVARITLSFVGGTSEIVGVIRHARAELAIAAAGPLTSLAVALFAALAHVAIVETTGPGLAATIAALIALANLAIALLNAVPGLPLDGGRMLRAALWAWTGQADAATRFVAVVGRRFGEGLIGFAVVASAFGYAALALWAALLGFVLRET